MVSGGLSHARGGVFSITASASFSGFMLQKILKHRQIYSHSLCVHPFCLMGRAG